MPMAVGTGLRERGKARAPTSPAVPPAQAIPATDEMQRAPSSDGTRRPDLIGLTRGTGTSESISATPSGKSAGLQGMPAAPQPAPTVPVTTTAGPALTMTAPQAADTAYAAVSSQSTELMATSVRDPAWGEQIADRVVLMAGKQLRSAEIRLTPAELGPLRVQVSVDEGAANVTFHAQHSVTRDALEQALPRLREMLAENGLSLGQADVSDRGVGGGEADAEERAQTLSADEAHDGSADGNLATTRRVASVDSLVDTFA